jgi:mRNA interferase MazF
VQVVPLSSKTGKLYPSETVVNFEGKENKAMADQLTTVSKERLYRRAAVLSREDLNKVAEAVKIQLGIE